MAAGELLSLSLLGTEVRIPDMSSSFPMFLPAVPLRLVATPSSSLQPRLNVQRERPCECLWSKTTGAPATSPVCAFHRLRCAAPHSQSVLHSVGFLGKTPLCSARVRHLPAYLRSEAVGSPAGSGVLPATRRHSHPTNRTGSSHQLQTVQQTSLADSCSR